MDTTAGYTVTIDGAIAHDTDVTIFEELGTKLHAHAGAVSYSDDGRSWSATISVQADRPDWALSEAQELVSKAAADVGLPTWIFVAAEVLTDDEADRRQAEPAFPELVGTAEVAELLGVSKQRASELRTRAGFPAPVAVLASGPVYLLGSITRFIETWDRSPGRPKATG